MKYLSYRFLFECSDERLQPSKDILMDLSADCGFESFEDENGECYIMKDISAKEDEEANFIFVEDDKELNAVFEIFEKMMNGEDVEITR